MYQRGLSLLFATVVACTSGLMTSGCTDDAPAGPAATELEELDAWTVASEGKADLPSGWFDLVDYVQDFYINNMSAIWRNQEHPATAAAAIARTRQLLAQAGIADPARVYFPTTIQRMSVEYFDHSELNIVLAPGKVIRLVGDSKGAGVFYDNRLFETTIGTKLCLTWDELQRAIRASYLSGAYGVDFVCHTVTERVLRELDVGSKSYANQVRTYQTARWIWGPLLPTWDSNDPADWDVARACPR